MLRKKLRNWFRRAGRDLPWRLSSDPYAVVVSEMMLQQTTVGTMIPYYKKWMNRFSTVEMLANAEEGEVLKFWQGLGYYNRARNFHKTAKIVSREFGGKFPRELCDLRLLPGIGEYTAAAIQAFAWDRPVCVIDANIARVLARLAAISSPVDKASGKAALVRVAESLLPSKRGGKAHTSALMDLGATICTSGAPRCHICPLNEFCLARTSSPEFYPVKAARKAVTSISETRGWVVRGGKIGLVRSEGPRWHGLWILPIVPAGPPPLHIELYPITRYRVRMELVPVKTLRGVQFFAMNQLPAMPSPHARAVRAVAGSTGSVHSSEVPLD